MGLEAWGGVRAIAAGVRITSFPNGAVESAPDRLPRSPSSARSLPDRLGGGFLFVVGATVWRADTWLGPASPLYVAAFNDPELILGLDRVYLRASSTPNAATQAIDPRTGQRLDLGPWPTSPSVGAYAAVDGWRAIAIVDLIGTVVTRDAGASWQKVSLAIDPRDLIVSQGATVVGGMDANRHAAWFDVRDDGRVTRLVTAPSTVNDRPSPLPLSSEARPFGRRPWIAAIEDGWPLADHTAVIARDGELARVRLSDGLLIDIATDAYALKSSRCHPLSLATGADPGAFGFVCGERHGRTMVFAYDPARAALVALQRFDGPRVVTAAANGTLCVRGPCTGDVREPSTRHAYCVMDRSRRWREFLVRGDVDGERVVPLADGRVALLSPPHGDLATAHVTVLGGPAVLTRPISFDAAPPEIARILVDGVWLDGFEERRDGVLGGWVEAGGTILGIEVDLSGKARHGTFIRDAGSPMVSGRYGLGWSAARRGYETTDGGMSWAPLELPEPLAADRTTQERACGPLGCMTKGWLRVGWGPSPTAAPSTPTQPSRPPFRSSVIPHFDCVAPPAASSSVHVSPIREGGIDDAAAYAPTFFGVAAPGHHAGEIALSVPGGELGGRNGRLNPIARLYAVGPKSEDWTQGGSRWVARWLWPFAGDAGVRSTLSSVSPFTSLDAARRALGVGAVPSVGWTAAVGDDASHALLLARHAGGSETSIVELEADRPPAPVLRADGEPFGPVDAAVRMGGHWYVATPQSVGELPATIVWIVDGAIARELARVPRAFVDIHSTLRLARHTSDRMIALVVEGQVRADRATTERWVLAIDANTGALGSPELLGPSVPTDSASIAGCTGETGWVLDTPSITMATLVFGGGVETTLSGTYARLRLSPDRICIERLSGALDVQVPAGQKTHDADAAIVPVSVTASGRRTILRCSRHVP